MTVVKVCGITNLEDGLLAAGCGAQAVGFVFAESPRRIAPATAREIARGLPPFVLRVGVFVNAPLALVADVAAEVGLDVLQLHGDESPAYLARARALGRRLIKAVGVRGPKSLAALDACPADGFLLDSGTSARRGGTGKEWRWELAGTLPRTRFIMLAGGLRPDNVRRALETVRPHGVDVSSGVEREPGRKDPGRLRTFLEEVRRYDHDRLPG